MGVVSGGRGWGLGWDDGCGVGSTGVGVGKLVVGATPAHIKCCERWAVASVACWDGRRQAKLNAMGGGTAACGLGLQAGAHKALSHSTPTLIYAQL